MPKMTFKDAVLGALQDEMRRDSRVIVMGQDVEFSMLDPTASPELDRERVRNTPICEAAFIGTGIGAALTGLRPVIALGCSTFLYSAMDQVVNQAAKNRYMFGGQANVPLVIRAPVLYSIGGAAHHSDRPWGLFAQAPGLKIVIPTTPYDAKGLLLAAIRDGNPVIFFEDVTVRGECGEVPASDYVIPIGLADVKRSGTDVTIVAIGGAVRHSLVAAETLASAGISVEVVDPRTIVPLDRETIRRSVAKTGRLIIVDPAPGNCGVAAEVAAWVAQHAFEYLQSPIVRLSAPDVPVPFSPALERLMYPTADAIVDAARAMAEVVSPRSGRRAGRVPHLQD